MAGLSTVLSIATSALRVQQQRMEVTSHNLANSGTEGYSRQRAVVATATPTYTTDGAFGGGAVTLDVRQVRDVLLDRNARSEFALAAESDARSDTLTRVEGVLAEPGDASLSAIMDRFFAAWSDLANDPASSVGRTVARQRSGDLAVALNGFAASLEGVRADTETRLGAVAARIDQLGANIADLNRQIVSAEVGGTQAPDLRDLRNHALDELSGLVSIEVYEDERGSVGVSMGGIGIVSGTSHAHIGMGTQAGDVGLTLAGVPGILTAPGGQAQGLIRTLNEDLRALRQGLDALALALVTEANAAHATGTNVDGGTGFALFDPTGTSANSIRLSAEVAASARAIAAGTGDGTGAYRGGANDVALALAGLRDVTVGALGAGLHDHYTGLVSSLGQAVRSARDSGEIHGTLAEQADRARTSVSGVSTDEELVQMIQFQTAYQAAARVVTAADEMLQSVLAM